MECHHSSEKNNNLDSLKLVMKHCNDLNVGSKDCEKGGGGNCLDDVHGKLTLLEPAGKSNEGLYDMPLPFFGCGIGWFSFVAGFICPPFWYYATILYYHRKDPRERAGLAASAIAALISTVIILAVLLAVLVPHASRSC